MLLRRLFLVFLLSAIIATPIATMAADRESYYVSATDLPPTLLPPPHEKRNTAWKEDIQAIIAAQRHISTTDLAALRDEQHMRIELVTNVMGSNFTREKKPATFALLDHVMSDASVVSEADKNYWHTKRPYLEDRRVKLLVNRIDNSPAYPSGHTSESRVLAEIVGLLYPDHLEALRSRAEAVAWHRVQAGVHYPHDLEAGRMLAMLTVGALMKSSAFQDDLATTREETR